MRTGSNVVEEPRQKGARDARLHVAKNGSPEPLFWFQYFWCADKSETEVPGIEPF
jgi:hypothetical protein